MPRLTLPLLALCAFLVAPVALAQEKTDASTPKAAAVAFFKAMERGDVAAAKSMATGSDKQLGVLDVMVPLVQGFKQLERSAVKKWGDDGRKTLIQQSGSSGGLDFDEQVKNAKEEVNGDVATITPPDAKDTKKDPIKLKKVGAAWKLDMAAISADGIDDPTNRLRMTSMADIARQTATEIDAGQYPDAAAAKKAMGEKIKEMVKRTEKAPAGDQPGAGAPPK
jgi:hypothetical protein